MLRGRPKTRSSKKNEGSPTKVSATCSPKGRPRIAVKKTPLIKSFSAKVRCSGAHVFPKVKYTESWGEVPKMRERREWTDIVLFPPGPSRHFFRHLSFSPLFLFLRHLCRLPPSGDNCRSAEFISRNLLTVLTRIFLSAIVWLQLNGSEN